MMKVENRMSVKSLRACCLRAAVFALAVSAVADVFAAVERNPIVFPVRRNVEIKFLPCPEGSFVMGKEDDKKPQSPTMSHKVTFTRPFWLSEHKITHGQWNRFSEPIKRIYRDKRNRKTSLRHIPFDTIPVSMVSYFSVLEYCKNLNRRFKSKLPKGYVIRLPTEAEWEYALKANATDSSDPYVKFMRGSHAEQDDAAKTIMVQDEDHEKWLAQFEKLEANDRKWASETLLHPIGTKKPNQWGFYDMIGNGSEMMLDTIAQPDPENRTDWTRPVGKSLAYLDEEVDPLRADILNEKKKKWEKRYDCLARGGKPNNKSKDRFAGSAYRKSLYPTYVYWNLLPSVSFRLCIGPDLIKEKNAEEAKAARKKR